MTDDRTIQLPIADARSGHSCACCSTGQANESTETVVGTVSATYGVTGMTCEHCVRSVTEELSAIPAVTGVEVALEANGVSKVTVHSDAPVGEEVVAAAIDEAGYRLVAA